MNSRLCAGTAAPPFRAKLWDGSIFDLSTLRGKKVWLAFFRYASCPLCNLRVHEIMTRYESLKAAGIAVISVFQSSGESISNHVGKQKPPFPIVADPNETLYKLFRLESDLAGFLNPANLPLAKKALQAGFMPGKPDGTLTRIPADFLIDPQGIIREAFYGNKIGDHIPFESVMHFANAPSDLR